jgi:serine/threonine-protein kinase
MFTAAAVVLGLVAGGVISLLRPKRVEIVERAAAVPEPTTSAVEVKEARMAATPTNLGSKLAACTSSYLPKGAFGKAPEVEFLCTETDPRTGAGKLHAAVVSAAPKGGVPPTDAMKIFARIGWYDMAAFAVVRAGCCPEAPPISLPDAQCGMDASLRAIGEAVIASKPTVEPLKAYTDSIHCELNRGGAKWLRRSERPAGGEDTAFLELLKNLE